LDVPPRGGLALGDLEQYPLSVISALARALQPARSVQIEAGLEEKGLQSRIHRRAARNRPLTERAGEVQDWDDEPRLQHSPPGSAVSAVRPDLLAGVGDIEHIVQLLTVMHGRVRRTPFADQLVSTPRWFL
jgi:hypothetical protein